MNSAKSYAILLLNLLNSAKLFQAVEQPGEHVPRAAQAGPARGGLPHDAVAGSGTGVSTVRPIAEAPAADY